MGIDWRWGAEWFESLLLDYDPAQNYCNWNYIVGVAFNVCASRYFNIMKQAETFDSEGKFVKLWIPSLESCPVEFIHKPFAMTVDQKEEFDVDYPSPCSPLVPPPSKKKKFENNGSNGNGSGKKKQRLGRKARRALRLQKEKEERERKERELREQQELNNLDSNSDSSDSPDSAASRSMSL